MVSKSRESFAYKMVEKQKLRAMRKCLGTAGSTVQEGKQAQAIIVNPVHGHLSYKLQTLWTLRMSLDF